ncbi:MAG TPA: M23 family metallopeptidase, partial [Clostridia bacterium]|nr:M23 family metallopeptidase [Clostridia bacterium]
MEDIAVARQRYPRHNVPVKRRNKKSSNASSSYLERMMFKVLICIVIMVVIGIIKSVNTPVTKMMCGKIKAALMQNIDLKSEFNGIIDLIKKSAGTSKDNTTQKVQSAKNKTSAEEIVKFITPVEGSITSPFGMRTDPFSDTQKSHSGVDIEANKGDKINAAADGEVILAGASKVYGNYLKVKHSNGLVTLYAHCSKIIASKGQKVRQGDIIAEVGNTGASTGSHLHFEVIKD